DQERPHSTRYELSQRVRVRPTPRPRNPRLKIAAASIVARLLPSDHTKRFCSAYRTAFVRSLTPSLEKMLDTWFLTVPSLILSAFAISRLLMPLVISFSTSVS